MRVRDLTMRVWDLTMRVWDLILRSIARCVSKAAMSRFSLKGKTACAPARNGYSYPFRNG
jgi:hypothetical protein